MDNRGAILTLQNLRRELKERNRYGQASAVTQAIEQLTLLQYIKSTHTEIQKEIDNIQLETDGYKAI